MNFSTWFFAASAALATPAIASERLDEFLGKLQGQEVTARGDIGYFHSTAASPSFYFPGGYFNVDFALDRDALKEIDACMLADQVNGCTVDVAAETVLDGTEIKLLIYGLDIVE